MARKKKGESDKGGVLVLLFLLAGMMAGGAWNYQRNLALESEQQGSRPFKTYSDEALDQLEVAYEEDARSLERRYKASLARRTGYRENGGMLNERVDEFDRVRQEGNQIRMATAEVAERDARLREIREEKNFRHGQDGWGMHLKRLTNI